MNQVMRYDPRVCGGGYGIVPGGPFMSYEDIVRGFMEGVARGPVKRRGTRNWIQAMVILKRDAAVVKQHITKLQVAARRLGGDIRAMQDTAGNLKLYFTNLAKGASASEAVATAPVPSLAPVPAPTTPVDPHIFPDPNLPVAANQALLAQLAQSRAHLAMQGAWPAQGYAFPKHGFLTRPHGYAAMIRTRTIPKQDTGTSGSYFENCWWPRWRQILAHAALEQGNPEGARRVLDWNPAETRREIRRKVASNPAETQRKVASNPVSPPIDDLLKALRRYPGYIERGSGMALKCAPWYVIVLWKAYTPIPSMPTQVQYGNGLRPLVVRTIGRERGCIKMPAEWLARDLRKFPGALGGGYVKDGCVEGRELRWQRGFPVPARVPPYFTIMFTKPPRLLTAMGAAGSPGTISTAAALKILSGLQVQYGVEKNDPGWPMHYVTLLGAPSISGALKIVAAARHIAAAGLADNDPTGMAKVLVAKRTVIIKWPANKYMATFNQTVGNLWNGRNYVGLGAQKSAGTTRRGRGHF